MAVRKVVEVVGHSFVAAVAHRAAAEVAGRSLVEHRIVADTAAGAVAEVALSCSPLVGAVDTGRVEAGHRRAAGPAGERPHMAAAEAGHRRIGGLGRHKFGGFERYRAGEVAAAARSPGEAVGSIVPGRVAARRTAGMEAAVGSLLVAEEPGRMEGILGKTLQMCLQVSIFFAM